MDDDLFDEKKSADDFEFWSADAPATESDDEITDHTSAEESHNEGMNNEIARKKPSFRCPTDWI